VVCATDHLWYLNINLRNHDVNNYARNFVDGKNAGMYIIIYRNRMDPSRVAIILNKVRLEHETRRISQIKISCLTTSLMCTRPARQKQALNAENTKARNATIKGETKQSRIVEKNK
jgi:hypothetical protein